MNKETLEEESYKQHYDQDDSEAWDEMLKLSEKTTTLKEPELIHHPMDYSTEIEISNDWVIDQKDFKITVECLDHNKQVIEIPKYLKLHVKQDDKESESIITVTEPLENVVNNRVVELAKNKTKSMANLIDSKKDSK